MNSMICRGYVMHERKEKAGHRFEYPVYFYVFDLDEFDDLDKQVWGFGYNKFSVASMHDTDYLQRGEGGIRQKLDRFLESKGLKTPVERVMLVTCARFFNHVFNPVSFYYCYSKDASLVCVVMEVNNTFDERHLYILDQPLEDSNDKYFHAQASKEFHISPFFDRQGYYDCRFAPLGEKVDIHFNLYKKGNPALISRWYGKTVPLTTAHLIKTVIRYPFNALLTLPRIHWQAAKLYFGKKIKHFKKPTPRSTMTIRLAQPKPKHKIAMKFIFNALKQIKAGKLSILLPGGSAVTFGDPDSGPQAVIRVNHYDFFWKLLKDAGIGLGESFMANDWESPDPVAVHDLLILNKRELERKDKWLGKLGGAANRLFHLIRNNSLSNSRKNISEHYDLSNDVFKLFLDPKMMYSCAFFSQKGESLEQAQQNKLDMLIQKARIGKNDHVLEIGCGWGGFAIEAVKQTGCRVTGITLSEEQLSLARERVKANGLEDRIELHLCDYRKLRGQFDRIISVEMLEAVGHEYLDDYFKACDRLLKPDGIGVIQVITMADQRYEQYRKGCDFIQKHIFPGVHLPSLTALCESMTRSTGFMIEHVENIGDHYAETLKQWRITFLEKQDKIKELGFDDIFIRKWAYYFIYCESAYRMRHINNLQFVMTRAGNRMLSADKEVSHDYANRG